MNWLDKTWNFERSVAQYKENLDFLGNSPASIRAIISGKSENELTSKPDGKWSINEHIGHLLTMESLWIARLDDFVLGKSILRPWNGTNSDTDAGEFNKQRSGKILEDFESIRFVHIGALQKLESKSTELKCFHERLQRDLNLADHVLFMKEHDEHHLQIIRKKLSTI